MTSLDADRLAVLVHEVRSPVAALSAIAETLARGELDSEGRHTLVRLVLLACASIERIVTDASVVSIRLEQIDPVELVGDVVAAAALRGARIELTSQDGVPAIGADPPRLRQVLDNLIVNALVHAGPDEPVAVAVRVDTMVRISVSDVGPGIPAEALERIFEPRVRLDPDGTSGAGLGLTIARTVTEGHGGTLTVESSSGAGATFTVSLPRVD
jgi:signal transduction histidine kinase